MSKKYLVIPIFILIAIGAFLLNSGEIASATDLHITKSSGIENQYNTVLSWKVVELEEPYFVDVYDLTETSINMTMTTLCGNVSLSHIKINATSLDNLNKIYVDDVDLTSTLVTKNNAKWININKNQLSCWQSYDIYLEYSEIEAVNYLIKIGTGSTGIEVTSGTPEVWANSEHSFALDFSTGFENAWIYKTGSNTDMAGRTDGIRENAGTSLFWGGQSPSCSVVERGTVRVVVDCSSDALDNTYNRRTIFYSKVPYFDSNITVSAGSDTWNSPFHWVLAPEGATVNQVDYGDGTVDGANSQSDSSATVLEGWIGARKDAGTEYVYSLWDQSEDSKANILYWDVDDSNGFGVGGTSLANFQFTGSSHIFRRGGILNTTKQMGVNSPEFLKELWNSTFFGDNTTCVADIGECGGITASTVRANAVNNESNITVTPANLTKYGGENQLGYLFLDIRSFSGTDLYIYNTTSGSAGSGDLWKYYYYNGTGWNATVTGNITQFCNGSDCKGADNTDYYIVMVLDGFDGSVTQNIYINVSALEVIPPDITPPTITIDLPANTTYYTSDTWFNATMNESGTGDWMGVDINGTNYSLTNETGNWYLNTGVADGSYTANFYGNDSAGNMGTASVVFTIDTSNPVVTIVAPTNITYIDKNITVNFTVTDSTDASVTCYKDINGTGQSSLGTILNNTYFSEGINFSAGSHNVNISCVDAGGLIGESIVYFSNVEYNVTDNRTYESSVYEINGTNYAMEIELAEYLNATGCPTAYLHLTNDTTFTDVKVTANVTDLGAYRCNYTVNTNMYLVNVNDTGIQHRWNISFSELGQTYSSWVNQTVYWAFYPDAQSADPASQLEGFTSQLNITPKEKTGDATIQLWVNVEGTNYSATKEQSYYYYDYTVPALSSDTTHYYYGLMNITYIHPDRVNAINTFYRNLTNSSLGVYIVNITNCTDSGYATVIYHMKDEQATDNYVNASLDITLFKAIGGIAVQNHSFGFAENYTHQICIYPTWANATFNVSAEYDAEARSDGVVNYSYHDYSKRNYHVTSYRFDNNTGTVYLYLLNNTDSNAIEINLEDINLNPESNAIIQYQRYYYGENKYRTVGWVLTDDDGSGVGKFENDVEYRFIVEVGGDIQKTTGRYTIDSGLIENGITINLGEDSRLEWTKYNNRYSAVCGYYPTTERLVCDVDDDSGHMGQACLEVYEEKIVGNRTKCSECVDIEVGTTSTFVCDLVNSTDRTFHYSIRGYFNSEPTTRILISNFIDNATDVIYGSSGLFIGLIIIVGLVGLGSYSPFVAMSMGVLGLVITYMMGLQVVSLEFLIGIIFVGAVMIFKMRS